MSHEKPLRSIDREAEQKRNAEKQFPTPPVTPDDKKVLHELDQDQHGPEFYAEVGPRKGAHAHRGDAHKDVHKTDEQPSLPEE